MYSAKQKFIFKLATSLFQFSFPLYKFLYYKFKKSKDAYQLHLIKQVLKRGDTVLDIGANVGFYIHEIKEMIGVEGIVHGFEPDETNFNHLTKNINGIANVHLNKMAVADTEGELSLYTSDMLNVENTTYKPEHYKSVYKVKKVSIDKYLGANNKVDFIKMDIQGAEYPALTGMQKTIQANNNLVIMTEVWPYGLRNCGNTVQEVFDFLYNNGMKIFLINESSLSELKTLDDFKYIMEEKYYYNILASRNSLVNIN